MCTIPSVESVARLAEIGKSRHPQLAARIDRAAQIVIAGEYRILNEYEHIIRGYRVIDTLAGTTCECPDYLLGGAPSTHAGLRCCKHILAHHMLHRLARDARTIQHQPAERPQVWAQSLAWRSFAASYH